MCIFSTLRGYISCREKGNMGFFHNSWSTIGIASKIFKKNHLTIMATWVMAAWTWSKMQFLRYFGALLLSKRLFSYQFFLAKVLYYYSRYNVNSFEKIFCKGLALIEGSELNFSILCLAILRLAKKFWEKEKSFLIEQNVYFQKYQ